MVDPDRIPIPMGIPWDPWDPGLSHSHAHLYSGSVYATAYCASVAPVKTGDWGGVAYWDCWGVYSLHVYGMNLTPCRCSHSFGYDSTRVSNLHMLDKDTIAYVAGAFLVIQNIKTGAQKYLQATGRVCFGAVTVSSTTDGSKGRGHGPQVIDLVQCPIPNEIFYTSAHTE